MPDRPPFRCQRVREDDGTTVLIPGCWSRVADPDAVCLCGKWDEDEAAETIAGLRRLVYRVESDRQTLRATLRRNGIPDPTIDLDWKAQTARRRRRWMHQMINGEADA